MRQHSGDPAALPLGNALANSDKNSNIMQTLAFRKI